MWWWSGGSGVGLKMLLMQMVAVIPATLLGVAAFITAIKTREILKRKSSNGRRQSRKKTP